jgi:uracil-DNA glycosylase
MPSPDKLSKVETLRKQIASCKRCPLHRTRTNAVPGEGDVDAKILFIGEAPGQNEDLQGKPFVGRAGAVFDELLRSIKLTREQIYLCNILKCRPPGNRPPQADEIRACVGSLDIQIKTVNPQVIATMGNFATTYIFEKFGLPPAKISAVHGKVFSVGTPFGPQKVVPLFHPAVATYDASKMPVLLKDMKILNKN